jgi:hypothetical protein
MNTRLWVVLVILAAPLVFLGSKIEWGYHEESGPYMAGRFEEWQLPHGSPTEARAFASDVCGEPVEDFRTGNDDTSYSYAMAELAVSRHFTLYGLYRNTVWVDIGTKDKFCLARYAIAMRLHGCVWPFPYCNQYSWSSLEEVRLINRITTRPKTPPGVRAIFPGECVNGKLEAGEAAKFQVEIPPVGQEVEVFAPGDNPRKVRLQVLVSKNGQPAGDFSDRGDYSDHGYHDKDGGGTYLIILRAPAEAAKHFILKVFWSGTGPACPEPAGWRDIDPIDPKLEQATP